MQRVLKWLAVGLGVLVGLVAIAAVGLNFVGRAQLNTTRTVDVEPVSIPTDEIALARGKHLVEFLCTDCHGADLTGSVIFDDPAIATFHAANITGLKATFSDEDLVRAIRHAVAPDGRELAIMPSEAFVYFSREDLGAVIAYLETVPRTGDSRPTPRTTFLGRVLLGAGVFGILSQADVIDHNTPFPPMPEVGPNVATGEYISRFCYGCHGMGLTGGQPADPASPIAPSLAGIPAWSEDAFMTFIQTGVTPYGRQVDPNFMPVRSLTKLDPDELRGLYLYLSTKR